MINGSSDRGSIEKIIWFSSYIGSVSAFSILVSLKNGNKDSCLMIAFVYFALAVGNNSLVLNS